MKHGTALLCILWLATSAGAIESRTCPSGINDTPALGVHLSQADVLRMPFPQVVAAGQRIFVTDFNVCDGAGRPGTNGGVKPRTPDPAFGPRFTRISGPDASSCAGCHNQPQAAGAGDFVGNVFVLAQNATPVSGTILNPDFTQTWLERNTLGMFGSGAIELLGREMTRVLQGERAQGLARARASGTNVTVPLAAKGVTFGSLVAHPDGSVDTTAVVGVDPDLVVKPFSRKGMMRSVREFSVNAFNQHHGMQAVERYGEGTDPDADGVVDELLVGDITAVSIFQEALPVPVQAPPAWNMRAVLQGQRLFGQVGCASCHVPALPLESTVFCDPDPLNPSTGPFATFNDTTQAYCFDLRQTSGLRGNMVAAYTDLKRHVICDASKPHYCNEPASPLQTSDSMQPVASDEFLTAKLWDVGNSAPWGHRGDLDTIYAAIVAHGGEAAPVEEAFEGLAAADQSAVVAFLKTLVMPIVANDPNPQQAGSPPGAPPEHD
ncbi:MAG TPA: di-heme oxidoredictase family protein [Candidatus Binatia bacterium]|nr:di-heme oxidoredictase family protein [Candidatus Binatia bacterium]